VEGTAVAQYEIISCNIDKYTIFKHNRTTTIKNILHLILAYLKKVP